MVDFGVLKCEYGVICVFLVFGGWKDFDGVVEWVVDFVEVFSV